MKAKVYISSLGTSPGPKLILKAILSLGPIKLPFKKKIPTVFRLEKLHLKMFFLLHF